MSSTGARGADTTVAYQRLDTATKESSLLSVDRPWHLKLQVSFYDKSGAVMRDGSFERWQSGDDSRTISTFDGDTRTVVQRGDEVYRESSGEAIPEMAETLLRAVLHPGPYPAATAGTLPDLRPTDMGKIKMDCIMLSRPMPHVRSAPLGLFPTYCLFNGDHIGAILHAGSQTVVREQTGKFVDHEVTVSATLSQNGTLVARAKVLQLSTFTPKPDEFEPEKELVKTSSDVKLSGGVISGKKIGGPIPVYPEAERKERASGTVVLEALIGTDGHIYELTPISAPAPDFAVSALVAVRDWTYTPYRVNGVPTEVTTTITVNYNMNSVSHR